MKKTLLTLLTMSVLSIFIMSCEAKKRQTFLNGNQHALLDVPETGRSLTFNENGQLFTIEIGVLDIGTYNQENLKGGMYTPATQYIGEYGKLFYNFSNGSHKLYMNLYSENLYRPTSGKARQTIYLYNNDGSTSDFEIDFSNNLAFKKIGGVTYTDVVLGIDRYRQDTLYWKKGLGVLGWKREIDNYTVYRVN